MPKQKVIIVTPGGSFFRDPHVKAFKKLGYDCAVFNSRHGFVYSPLFRRISRLIPSIKYLKKFSVYLVNQDLIRQVKKYKPQYLFAQKAETIAPNTIDVIKSLGVITANFYNDLMGDWPVISKIAPHYDYFFSQDHVVLKRLWNELGLKNCFYMAHAAEPLSDPFTYRDNKYRISFIGTYNKEVYPNREKYLMAVKDFGLYIWGNDEWLSTPLKDCFQGRSHGDERFNIYSQSKIVIDVNWEHFPSDGTSVRPFEVAASGACLFVDLVKADIKNVYEENKEFVSFSNTEELRDKINYYLGHDEEREKIARAGYERTIRDHTYDKRVRQMMDIIKNPDKYLYK